MLARRPSSPSKEEGHEPMRQCVVTRERVPQRALLRLALGPSGEAYVDVLGRAPGRGVYVTCDPEVLRQALSPKGLGRAFRGRAKPVDQQTIETMLQEAVTRLESRLLEMAGIARRAGLLELGMDCVLRAVSAPGSKPWLVITAVDFGASSVRKVTDAVAAAQGRGNPMRVIRLSSKQDIGSKLGRQEVGVIAIRPSRHADRMLSEAARWLALKGESSKSPEIPLTDVGHGEQSKGGSMIGTHGAAGEVK